MWKDREEIFKEAVETWGIGAQVEILIEEAAELILALQKIKRFQRKKKEGGDNRSYNDLSYAVIDNLADMKIMIAQTELIFGEERVRERVDYKMRRLKNMIIQFKSKKS